ncbi:zygote-specific protein [Penicillium herquei]|nr:zygote-specific protein [Penicillium herquei]
MKISKIVPLTLPMVLAANAEQAGYGVCQAGCPAAVKACYTNSGAAWGARCGAQASPAVITCNTAHTACQATSASVGNTKRLGNIDVIRAEATEIR